MISNVFRKKTPRLFTVSRAGDFVFFLRKPSPKISLLAPKFFLVGLGLTGWIFVDIPSLTFFFGRDDVRFCGNHPKHPSKFKEKHQKEKSRHPFRWIFFVFFSTIICKGTITRVPFQAYSIYLHTILHSPISLSKKDFLVFLLLNFQFSSRCSISVGPFWLQLLHWKWESCAAKVEGPVWFFGGSRTGSTWCLFQVFW